MLSLILRKYYCTGHNRVFVVSEGIPAVGMSPFPAGWSTQKKQVCPLQIIDPSVIIGH